jgi:hypothetical protein
LRYDPRGNHFRHDLMGGCACGLTQPLPLFYTVMRPGEVPTGQASPYGGWSGYGGGQGPSTSGAAIATCFAPEPLRIRLLRVVAPRAVATALFAWRGRGCSDDTAAPTVDRPQFGRSLETAVFSHGTGRSKSIPLQRRVSCEPEFIDQRAQKAKRDGRTVSSVGAGSWHRDSKKDRATGPVRNHGADPGLDL